jgi:hypothetical protein
MILPGRESAIRSEFDALCEQLGVRVGVLAEVDDMATMRSRVLPDFVRSFLHGLAWVVPNFNLYVPNHRLLAGIVENQSPPYAYVATALGYGTLYAAVLLILSAMVFRRRDFL